MPSLLSNEDDIVYDRFGAVRLRILKGGRIITWGGEHIGFLSGIAVYNYQGAHIGWWEGGILRDLNGATVGFGTNPTDVPRPYLPLKQYTPYRGYIQYAPYFPYRGYLSYKPYKQFGWSELDPISLFKGVGR
jgi:hypothetical protein